MVRSPSFVRFFALKIHFVLSFFAIYNRNDSYTLIHIFKPIHTHLDTAVHLGFLDKQFSGSFSFHFDFFASFRLFLVHFRFRFWHFCFDAKQAKSCHFFASKGNEILASISIFASARSENEGAPYTCYITERRTDREARRVM